MNRLFLVTGACGHVGNTLVKSLLNNHENVRALALANEDTTSLKNCKVDLFYGDVRDKKSLQPFFDTKGFDEVFCIHCAGIVSISSTYDQRVYDVNVLGTQNIVDLCIENKITRLVYISSVHAIPEQPAQCVISEIDSFCADEVIGLYAKTKSQATQIVLDGVKRGLDAVVVHPSGIIGPNDFVPGHSTQLVMDYLNGDLSACIKGGYDFVDVRDVAEGVIAAAKKGRKGECYILSNRFYSVSDLLEMLRQITGLNKIKVVLPKWFVKLIAPLAEVYYKIRNAKPLFTSYSLHTVVSNTRFSHDKANRELGYSPRDIKKTLVDTVAFLVRSGRIKKKRLAHSCL